MQTATGPIVVAREGDPRRPAILTYHDLALNYLSNFSVRDHFSASAKILPERIRAEMKILCAQAHGGRAPGLVRLT